MAQHGREPVQATVSQQQADSWAQAGGDVVELYDGPTLWNAVASAAKAERERLAKLCDHAADIAWSHWQCDADPIDQGRALAAEELAAEFRRVVFGPNARVQPLP
jgi:hypothetical protein